MFELVRVLTQSARPERSVEIFFYAGEESGLLGSGEIAEDYKNRNQDVVAVMQLDMTLFPGSGPTMVGLMRDYTSDWLNEYFIELNRIYVGAQTMNDTCGYGCSDHASWHSQGYPAVMPFEASFDGMNHNIHTDRDVIDSRSDFDHAAIYARLAVAFALDLGNSTQRAPN
ncbi:MAG: M28 family peptidase [Bdellovibrionales bacterium]|nr:M28 family peptidase [Bdellovibrionales bacterium]